MLRLALALLCALAAHAAEPFLNLGFEAVRGSHPRAWRTYGLGYESTADTVVAHSGKIGLRMECRGSCLGAGSAYQCLGATGPLCLQTFPLEVFRGKRIRYSGYIKTANVDRGYAGLSWEVDGKDGRLTYDDMHESGVHGTTPWTRYVIERQVDAKATEVEFGVRLAGNGTAWFDSLQIEVDGKIYPQPAPLPPAQPTSQQIDWLKRNAIPFDTDQAGHGFKDLQPLKKVIENARIVGLGEQTHGTSEFQSMKHRLIEFLASEMGFTIFAIEANMPETYPLNDYVLTGAGDPRQLVQGMHVWTWNTQEVLDMVMWMREFNQSGKGRIQFWGIDMQNPRPAMANVSKFLNTADPEFSGKVYQGMDTALSQPNASQAVKDAALQEAAEVLETMRAKRGLYTVNRKTSDVDWAIQNARIVVQAANANWSRERGTIRDRSMADNLEWIMEQAPGARIVLWAHNDHIAKEPGQLGGYLSARHSSNYRAFGFAFHQGRYNAIAGDGLAARDAADSYPGSVEYVLYRSGIPRFILDVRAAKLEANAWLREGLDWRNIGAVRIDGFKPNARLTSQFDDLIFIDRTIPSHLLALPPRPTP